MDKNSTSAFFPWIFLFLIPISCFSQSQIGAYFHYQPLNTQISEEGYRQGWGGGLEYLSPNFRKNDYFQLRLGGELSILESGHENRQVRGTLAEETDIDRISVRNMLFNLLGKVQVMGSDSWAVRPYANFLAGLGVFTVGEINQFGVPLVSCQNFPFCDERERFNRGSTWRFRTGVALGISFALNNQLNLHIKGTYLRTGLVRYANLEAVEMGDLGLNYNVLRTRINPISLQIGIQSNL